MKKSKISQGLHQEALLAQQQDLLITIQKCRLRGKINQGQNLVQVMNLQITPIEKWNSNFLRNQSTSDSL